MKTINDYAELVKEKHALNKTIAPVETDLTDASRGYHIGEQFIYDGGLFKAKTEIAQHDALVLNTNYEPADNLIEQIKNAGGGTGTDPRLDVFENNIAPVETDETDASRAYQVGEQLILDNILYDVIAPISEHDVITTTGSGANIAPADPISSQFQTLTNDLEDEIKTRLELGAHQLMPLDLASMKARNTSGTWNGNSYTRDGITYTVELDNYGNVIGFDVDGTGHNAPFVICPSTQITRLLNLPLIMSCNASPDLSFMAYQYNGTSNLSSHGDDVNVTFTSNNAQLQLYITSSSDKTFTHFKIYPLLRTKDDPSREFTPYVKTNKELTEDTNAIEPMLNVLGAKNLLKNTASPATVNGITFTIKDDGSITANGTATANTSLIVGTYEFKANQNVILSGCPSTGGANTYKLLSWPTTAPSSGGRQKEDNGQGVLLDYPDNLTCQIQIYINNGQVLNNITFYPMIRPADIEDSTFVPYAMTNRELTEKIHAIKTANYISKSADSSKTWATLMNEAVTVLNSLLATLGSGEYLTIQRVLVNGDHVNIPNDYMMNTSTFNRYGSELMVKADKLQAAELHLAASGSYFHRTDIISSGGTLTYNYTDVGAQVPTSGTVRIDYVIFN